MKSRVAASLVVGALAAAAATWACIPNPDGDYEDYQTRIANFDAGIVIETGTVEAAAPPTESKDGLYYGACLSQLGLGNPKLVFNFLTNGKLTIQGDDRRFSLTIRVLAVVNSGPPPTITEADVVGNPIVSPELTGPNVDNVTGKFSLALGTVIVANRGNPISGNEAEISNAGIEGIFLADDKFCGRLSGRVERPTATKGTVLDPPQNICRFVPIKEGDPTPVYGVADFKPEACPL